ncbi:MAG: hypothetical protein LBU89_00770 [Fibromonadaceae bacterium]|jgi:hypothetical protein|nr:hypothetical protein [Fibromonadaceae bacterium]
MKAYRSKLIGCSNCQYVKVAREYKGTESFFVCDSKNGLLGRKVEYHAICGEYKPDIKFLSRRAENEKRK